MVKIYAVDGAEKRQIQEADAFRLIETGDVFCLPMQLNDALCDVYNRAADSREVRYGRNLKILVERAV